MIPYYEICMDQLTRRKILQISSSAGVAGMGIGLLSKNSQAYEGDEVKFELDDGTGTGDCYDPSTCDDTETDAWAWVSYDDDNDNTHDWGIIVEADIMDIDGDTKDESGYIEIYQRREDCDTSDGTYWHKLGDATAVACDNNQSGNDDSAGGTVATGNNDENWVSDGKYKVYARLCMHDRHEDCPDEWDGDYDFDKNCNEDTKYMKLDSDTHSCSSGC